MRSLMKLCTGSLKVQKRKWLKTAHFHFKKGSESENLLLRRFWKKEGLSVLRQFAIESYSIVLCSGDNQSKWKGRNWGDVGRKEVPTLSKYYKGIQNVRLNLENNFQTTHLGTLVCRIDVHARLLILSKNSPLHGLIQICMFIDFEKKKIPHSRLLHTACVLVFVLHVY